MIVTAPNTNYCGVIGGDVFVEGVCKDPNPGNLWYYEQNGFGIGAGTIADTDEEATEELPAELAVATRQETQAKKKAWEDYATALGLDPTGMTRDQIITMVDEYETTSNA